MRHWVLKEEASLLPTRNLRRTSEKEESSFDRKVVLYGFGLSAERASCKVEGVLVVSCGQKSSSRSTLTFNRQHYNVGAQWQFWTDFSFQKAHTRAFSLSLSLSLSLCVSLSHARTHARTHTH